MVAINHQWVMFTNLATASVSAFPTTLDSEAKLMRSETMAAVP